MAMRRFALMSEQYELVREMTVRPVIIAAIIAKRRIPDYRTPTRRYGRCCGSRQGHSRPSGLWLATLTSRTDDLSIEAAIHFASVRR